MTSKAHGRGRDKSYLGPTEAQCVFTGLCLCLLPAVPVMASCCLLMCWAVHRCPSWVSRLATGGQAGDWRAGVLLPEHRFWLLSKGFCTVLKSRSLDVCAHQLHPNSTPHLIPGRLCSRMLPALSLRTSDICWAFSGPFNAVSPDFNLWPFLIQIR